MKSKFTALLAPIVLASVASAGIPCPNPLAYTLLNGHCTQVPLIFGGGGYWPVAPAYTPGGCVTPGKSGKKCAVKYDGRNVDYPKTSGYYRNRLGYNVYASCYLESQFWMGLKYDVPGETCDYCTGA